MSKKNLSEEQDDNILIAEKVDCASTTVFGTPGGCVLNECRTIS